MLKLSATNFATMTTKKQYKDVLKFCVLSKAIIATEIVTLVIPPRAEAEPKNV